MLRRMKAVALIGIFFVCALAANAQIPLVQIVWNPDHTLWPPVLQTTSGGTIGGNWHYQVTKTTLTNNTSGLTNPTYYTNGNYTLTVSSTQTVYSGASGVTTPLPDQSLNFTIANPYLAASLPADPAPLLWNPSLFSLPGLLDGAQTFGGTASNPPSGTSSAGNNAASAIPYASIPLSVTVDGGCYPCQASIVVWINFFNAYGYPLQAQLQKNVTLSPGKNTVTFYWDGSDGYGDTAAAGAATFDASVYYCYGYSQPHTAPFAVAVEGNYGLTYAFDAVFADLHSDYNDVYTPYWQGVQYSIPQGMEVTKIFDDGVNATFALQYVIYGKYQTPFENNPAYDYVYDCSGGQVDVYNGVTKILTQTLRPSDVTDISNDVNYRGATWDTVHTVNVTIPSSQSDGATFILSPQDSFGPFNNSHKSSYLTQAAYKTPAIPQGATITFDRTLIKVGHGPVSGLQTVNAYVTPYSAAAGLSFGTSKPSEALVVPDVSPPAHQGDTAVVKLTIVGQPSGTPVNPANPSASVPDCQITVNGVVPSQSPNILVLIPTRLSRTHPQYPDPPDPNVEFGTPPGIYYALNSASVPADPRVTWNPNTPLWVIVAGWGTPQQIQVWDQFGLNLDSIYKDAEVDEVLNQQPTNINSKMQSDGTYIDNVLGTVDLGFFVNPGGNMSAFVTDSLTVVNKYRFQPADPSLHFGPGSFTDNIPLVIDGNNLVTGVVNRVVTKKVINLTPSELDPNKQKFSNLFKIVWPPTLP